MLLQLEPESCTLENEYTLLSEQYESKKKDMIGNERSLDSYPDPNSLGMRLRYVIY